MQAISDRKGVVVGVGARASVTRSRNNVYNRKIEFIINIYKVILDL